VIFPFGKPFKKNSGIAVLRATSARTARSSSFGGDAQAHEHRGRAVVFENIEDFHRRIDDPKLAIDKNSVMVLKNCGPRATRHGRSGQYALPPKLLKKHHRHGSRIGCAHERHRYGTVVLHVAPEAAAAARSRSSRTATKSSSTSRSEARAARAGGGTRAKAQEWKEPEPPLARATGASISITCCKRTKAPISTFSWARAAPSCRATTTSAVPTVRAKIPVTHRKPMPWLLPTYSIEKLGFYRG